MPHTDAFSKTEDGLEIKFKTPGGYASMDPSTGPMPSGIHS